MKCKRQLRYQILRQIRVRFVSPMKNMAGGFRFAIDRGGTFTDVYSECPKGEVKVMKLLSVDPAYPDAPREGIRRILQEVKTVLLVLNCDGGSPALVFFSYVTERRVEGPNIDEQKA